MTPDIEKFYSEIGQAAVDCAPIDFVKIWITSEMLDDVSSTEIYYQTSTNKIHNICDNLEELEELLIQLRASIKSSKREPWSSLTFTIEHNGAFSIEYGYEDVSDPGLCGERRKKWIEKHFGVDAKIFF